MRATSLLAAGFGGFLAMAASAQTPPQTPTPQTSAPSPTAPQGTPARIRGTVEKLDGQNLTVKTRDGQDMTVMLAPNITVATLVKKSITDIKPNDFVASTGVKGTDGKLHAVEVRIFPESMRGSGEGQFAWDLTPDSTMTNATVTGTATQNDGHVLKVKFKGQESEYIVGPECPVLGMADGDLSLLKPGATVFVIALKKPDGSLTSSRLYAEKDGVKPPM